ncbi:MAG: hypothetical protein QOH13_2466, partial [Thermoleophilaceae bacterium]|nr:hypothetical protein [Thermoleophilaceae bacterium]
SAGRASAAASLARARTHLRPAHYVAALVVLLVVIVLAASSGGGSKPTAKPAVVPKPAAAGATVDAQLTQLEKIVRAAPRKP